MSSNDFVDAQTVILVHKTKSAVSYLIDLGMQTIQERPMSWIGETVLTQELGIRL